ncbi:type VII toxin-antitoxin system HepT family RNase toxin [Nitrospira sp. Kam-Ns4a]
MVDREVIRRHLQSLDEALGVLERHRTISANRLRTDVETRYIVERGLQVAIQNVLDLGTHVLTGMGYNRLETYTAVITGLADAKVIPRAFARRISKMPGLRNILVHEYARVQPAKLQAVLRTHLDDFRRFVRYFGRWLATHAP